jgi:hypothetical protein
MARKSQKQIDNGRRLGGIAKARGTTFKPGVSGNPGGKPVGTRNRLQGDFLRALADDFDQHGRAAIIRMREEDPAAYVRLVAQLMPKEFEINRPLDGLTDDELYAAIDRLRSQLAQERASESPPDGSPTIDESPTKH